MRVWLHGGTGDELVLDLDAVPRLGEDVYWGGGSYRVTGVAWFLDDSGDSGFEPVVRVELEGRRAPVPMPRPPRGNEGR